MILCGNRVDPGLLLKVLLGSIKNHSEHLVRQLITYDLGLFFMPPLMFYEVMHAIFAACIVCRC